MRGEKMGGNSEEEIEDIERPETAKSDAFPHAQHNSFTGSKICGVVVH